MPAIRRLSPLRRAAALLVTVALLLPLFATPSASASLRFSDVSDSNTFSSDIDWLASRGVTRGCNPPDNTRFCPDDHVTRGQMAAFLNRALGLAPSNESFSDTAGHTFEADIAALAGAGITKGCNPPPNTRFCPDDHVTRGQMAAFLNRALGLAPSNESFSDTAGHTFEADIAALAAAGITKGCNPPDNTRFCPDEYVTRGQMSAFLARALPGLPPVVSTGSNLVAATSSSYQPSISADGRFVAFPSDTSDTSGGEEIMVYDRSEGTAQNITSTLDGDWYTYPAISGDGRWVASYVGATGDDRMELWVTDRTTGTNHEVALVDGGGDGPDISHNGRYVVFESRGGHIDPSADPNNLNLYRWDRHTGLLDRFSVSHSGGNLTGGLSNEPLISGDGTRAIFTSNSPDVAADTPYHMGIPPAYLYMHDFNSDTTSLISRDEFGDPVPIVGYAAYSADGTTVAYLADIEDVLPSRNGYGWHLFIQDVASSALTLVPYPPESSGLNRTALSGDGTTLAYIADFGDEPNQLMAFSVPTRQTRVLSISSSGAPANQPVLANSFYPGRVALSDNGAWAAFTTAATNLGSPGGGTHVYVAETGQ